MEAPAPSLTEEDLTEVKKDALENLRVYLCEKIIAERHFDHLRAKKILSREDTEEISCRTSSRKRAGKLLDYFTGKPQGTGHPCGIHSQGENTELPDSEDNG